MNGHFQLDQIETRPNEEFPAPGIYEGLPARTYHDLEARASSSLLRRIHNKTPGHAKSRMESDAEPTKAMKFGTRMHEAVLEPDVFEQRYGVPTRCSGIKNDGDRCTYNGSHPFWETQGEAEGDEEAERELTWYCSTHKPEPGESDEGPEAADIEEIDEDQMEKIKSMRSVLEHHPAASQLLFKSPGMAELSIVGTLDREDGPSGIPVKARIDRLVRHERFGMIAVDYKTTRNAQPGPHEFGRTIENRRYDMQGCFYLWTAATQQIPVDTFVIVAQEKTPPYAVSTFLLPHQEYDTEIADLASAETDLNAALRQYKQCVTTNEWPTYPPTVQLAEVPAWGDAGTNE